VKLPVFTLDKIPTSMADATRWFPVAIEWNEQRQKWSKQPRCKWSDEANHRTLANVRGPAGFIAGGGFVTVDWDDCVRDGAIDAVVLEQVRALDTYAELSLSGTGVHAVAFGGPLPPGRRCEMWDGGHYVVMTGWRLDFARATVEPRQDQLVRLAYELTPGGMSVAERRDYVEPDEVFKKDRTTQLHKKLRSLKAQGDTYEGVKEYLRIWDAERCHPPKIAEWGEDTYAKWFHRSWHARDRAEFGQPSARMMPPATREERERLF
jgi:hypothetical protein